MEERQRTLFQVATQLIVLRCSHSTDTSVEVVSWLQFDKSTECMKRQAELVRLRWKKERFMHTWSPAVIATHTHQGIVKVHLKRTPKDKRKWEHIALIRIVEWLQFE